MEQSQATGAIGGALSGAATGSAFGAPGAIVGGVLGGISGFLGGGGEKEAKKLAKAQAAEIMRAADENRRLQTIQAAQQVGLAKATTYASNLQDTGTTRDYRTFMESEYRKAIEFDYESAQTQADLAREGGQVAANAIQSQGFGQLVGGITSLGGAYASGAFSSDPKLEPIVVTAQRRPEITL